MRTFNVEIINMTAIPEPPNIRDLLCRYESGETIKEISHSIGVDLSVFRRWLSKYGVRIRHGSESRKIQIPSEVISRYQSGESEYAIANSLGITRAPLRKYLIDADVKIRSRSKAGIIRASKMTGEERLQQSAAAHAAVRGKPRKKSANIIGAKTRQRATSCDSKIEDRFFNMIVPFGYCPVRQKAVSIYNLDFAFEKFSVAVELFGGGWHATGKHARVHFERSKYLLDQGWDLICIWIDNTRFPLTVGSAEYVAAFLDEVRGLPAGRRQYRMIRGTGEPCSAVKSQLNTDAIVKRLGGCRDFSECTNQVTG